MSVPSYDKKRVLAAVMKNFEVTRLPWITQVGPKCTHVYPYNQESEGDFTQGSRQRGDRPERFEEGGLEDWGDGATSRGGLTATRSLCGHHSRVDTLTVRPLSPEL